MILEQSKDEGTAVVHLCGALTHVVFERFNSMLDVIHQTGARQCVVDLSDVDFIDSSGIGMLLMGQELAEQRECRYRLRGLRPGAWAILEQAHVSELFDVDPVAPADRESQAGSAAA